MRTDSAGAAHELVDWCRDGRLGFSVGFDLTESIRSAILDLPKNAWVSALDQDEKVRPNGQVVELTDLIDLSSCRSVHG